MTKYPVGSANRWESMRDFIGSKSQKDIMKKVQDITKKKETDAEDRKMKEA